MHRRIGCALVIAVGLGGLAWMIRALESSFIYFPSREQAATPADYGLRAETLALEAGGGVRLAGWWIHGDGRRALLLFHGNGGNASHRLERAKLLVEAFGLDVALVDYRGYGASTGEPSEDGLYADGEAIYLAAAGRGFAPGRIVLFGESLGCAVALETALRHRCGGVILETPFLSIAAMARRYYPFVPPFLLRTKYDNERKIAAVTAPKLIMSAEKDDVVPPDHARRLFELARPPKEFYVIRGATHNDTYIVGGRDYLEAWRRFLDGLEAAPSP